MKHWLSIASRSAVTLAAVWCVAAATPLVAQQVTAPAPQPAVSTPQASATSSTSLPGPRLSSEWRRVEPRIADNSAATTASSGSTTITVTTLVLVLVVIIAVLLIAK